jgi:hypothetical protein
VKTVQRDVANGQPQGTAEYFDAADAAVVSNEEIGSNGPVES